jgi:acyl-coenzyme A synthetase/AMP-(fatty) acid ligase
MSAHLYDALTARFPKRDKPFLRTPEGRELSYRGLEEGSGRIASVLHDLGVGPGDRVADFLAAEYCLHAGGDRLFPR